MPDALTPEAVLAMPAGPETNRLVATMVFGYETNELGFVMYQGSWCISDAFRYSSSQGWIGPLIDWLRERWGEMTLD